MIVHASLLQVLTLLVSTVLPLLVALVTNKFTNSGTRSILLAGLATVTGFIAEWIHAINVHAQFDLWTAVFTAITGFVTAVAAHYGLWKPSTVSAKLQAIGSPNITTPTKAA